MTPEALWQQIEKNAQRVAEEDELVPPGGTFQLTPDQQKTIHILLEKFRQGVRRALLKAPTGSGKTEVAFRIAVHCHLSAGDPVVMLTPTRDLARQQHEYFRARLEGTPLEAVQMHGGIPPRQRNHILERLQQREPHFVVGSAMLLQHRRYRWLLYSSSLLVVDDVNAFDEEEDLQHLRHLPTPILFQSATPEAVRRFLEREGAWDHRVEMTQMPFDSPPTRIHEIRADWNENPFSQVDRAMDILQKHVEAGSRIYIISRSRARVPVLARYVEGRLGVPVSMLHGEMADTAEHRRRFGGKVREARIEMMKRFRESRPAVMVATNLVGSGLDIPLADMVLITDADHFGEAEKEQLMGRVGRRERESDAVLIQGTVARHGALAPRVKASSYVRNGRIVLSFRARPRGRKRFLKRRIV